MSTSPEVILVDIGNTSIKSAEAVNGEITNQKYWKSIEEVINNYEDLPFAVSSVKDDATSLEKKLAGHHFLIIDRNVSLPIALNYDTPETLGIDRIALACGANYLYPEENNLIIDLGTCATMDVIDQKGIFQGGVISPGLTMRMKSMATFTANLPDITTEWQSIQTQTLGKTTKQCLVNGSLEGLLREINGLVETLVQDFTSLNIIITGGDAHFFESRLKAHIFAGSKIVEIGIYRIWKHQLRTP